MNRRNLLSGLGSGVLAKLLAGHTQTAGVVGATLTPIGGASALIQGTALRRIPGMPRPRFRWDEERGEYVRRRALRAGARYGIERRHH